MQLSDQAHLEEKMAEALKITSACHALSTRQG